MTRREANVLIDGGLVVGGVVAVVDNALVHWVLDRHGRVDGWSGTLYAEVGRGMLGAAMLALAGTGLHRRAPATRGMD